MRQLIQLLLRGFLFALGGLLAKETVKKLGKRPVDSDHAAARRAWKESAELAAERDARRRAEYELARLQAEEADE